MLGSHVLQIWSATQASLALSSGGAEFYGVVKGAGIGLGMRALYRDIGVDVPLRCWTDSSAAIGICGRQGFGKLRHLACQTLWVQQRIRQGDFELRKVRGDENFADLFTKHMDSEEKLIRLVQMFGGSFVDGRAAAAPALRREDALAVSSVETTTATVTPSVCNENNSGPRNPYANVLPHAMRQDEIDTYFARAPIIPAPLGEGDEEPDPDCKDPGPFASTGFARRVKPSAEQPKPSLSKRVNGGTIALVQLEDPITPIRCYDAALGVGRDIDDNNTSFTSGTAIPGPTVSCHGTASRWLTRCCDGVEEDCMSPLGSTLKRLLRRSRVR